MYQLSTLSLAALALASLPLCAQGTVYNYASPRGIEFFEGNSSSNIMLGNYSANTRVQQIDNNLVGTALPLIRYLGWRRDGSSAGSSGKSVTLTIVMSHADYATVTSSWASNYKDAPKTVFSQKSVNLPDWSTAYPAARFDCYVPLDVPFVYNGQDALLWDVINSNNALVAMAQDWQSTAITHSYGAYPKNLGGGCQTSRGIFQNETMFRAGASNLEFGVQVKQGPAQSSIFSLIGAVDPNVPIPGFCGTLHVDPMLILFAGTTDTLGEMAVQTLITVPWSAGLAGLQLYSQLLAYDPVSSSTPFLFSNGVLAPAPKTNSTSVAIDVKRIYSTNPTGTSGTGPSVSACPTVYGL